MTGDAEYTISQFTNPYIARHFFVKHLESPHKFFRFPRLTEPIWSVEDFDEAFEID